MNLELLYETIKQICVQHNMSVSQLEKNLSFSTGSIGKWKTSAPSIEKVYAVAEYFGTTLDQLCGIKSKEDENEVHFLEKVIEETKDGSIVWFECITTEVCDIKYHAKRLIDLYDEVHMSQTEMFELYVCLKNGSVQTIDLYICVEKNRCKRLSVNRELLKKLQSCIRKNEDDSEQRIFSVVEEYMSITN